MGVWSAPRCRSTWSALGPHGIGNRWSWAGTSGHDGYDGVAGRSTFPLLTSVAQQRGGGFESHLTPAASAPLPTEAGGILNEARWSPELFRLTRMLVYLLY